MPQRCLRVVDPQRGPIQGSRHHGQRTGRAGENARVNIQADGDVESWSDKIGDHRLVFMSHNCGAWRFRVVAVGVSVCRGGSQTAASKGRVAARR